MLRIGDNVIHIVTGRSGKVVSINSVDKLAGVRFENLLPDYIIPCEFKCLKIVKGEQEDEKTQNHHKR